MKFAKSPVETQPLSPASVPETLPIDIFDRLRDQIGKLGGYTNFPRDLGKPGTERDELRAKALKGEVLLTVKALVGSFKPDAYPETRQRTALLMDEILGYQNRPAFPFAGEIIQTYLEAVAASPLKSKLIHPLAERILENVVPERGAHVDALIATGALDLPKALRTAVAGGDTFNDNNIVIVEKLLKAESASPVSPELTSEIITLAARKKDGRLLDLLVAHGADIDTKNADGQTPLLRAVLDIVYGNDRYRGMEAEASAVKLLLDRKPDLFVKSKHGQTILDLAISHYRGSYYGSPQLLNTLFAALKSYPPATQRDFLWHRNDKGQTAFDSRFYVCDAEDPVRDGRLGEQVLQAMFSPARWEDQPKAVADHAWESIPETWRKTYPEIKAGLDDAYRTQNRPASRAAMPAHGGTTRRRGASRFGGV